jgi:hypothetical protein
MKITSLMAALVVLAAPFADAAGPAAPAATYDDTARFLAGLPVNPASPVAGLTGNGTWKQHSDYFNSAWNRLEARQLTKVRDWSGGNIHRRSPVVFYMFSGPDFLYANAFFPSASTYVLCGTEPVGTVPDVTKLNLGNALYQMESSLNSVLNYSFFQTKQMRSDFSGGQLNGTIPVLMVFLARSGKIVQNVSMVQPHGVKIDFNGGSLYYFSVDLSNGSVERSGLLGFCQKLGRGDSLLKSASYLPHQPGFTTIDKFLLSQSDLIVQDDAGIPFKMFDPADWTLRLYGNYQAPIDIFKQFYQPDLSDAFSKSHPMPLPFGIGYRGWDPRQSALIVAYHK